MSAEVYPVHRPLGLSLVVGNDACRAWAIAAMGRRGLGCEQTDDPYQAMLRLCRSGQGFGCVILSLNSLYREELCIISAIKSRWPHLEIWLANTDGRQAALAEAIRLGADGLLAQDGLHRLGAGTSATPPKAPAIATAPSSTPAKPVTAKASTANEPILTAEELRALLEGPAAATMRESSY